MIVKIWDYLFTRRHWRIIHEEPVVGRAEDGSVGEVGRIYVLQDQFGDVKKKVFYP